MLYCTDWRASILDHACQYKSFPTTVARTFKRMKKQTLNALANSHTSKHKRLTTTSSSSSSTTRLSTIKTLVNNALYPQAIKVSATGVPYLHLITQIYSLFIKSGCSLHRFLGSFLIKLFADSGEIGDAHRFLLDMPETDTVSWNAMISGYAKNKQRESAFGLFNQLRNSGLEPDVFTLSSLLKSCNGEDNEQAHCAAIKLGFASSVFVQSCLVDNYSNAGELGFAQKCFWEFQNQDTVIWTTMISGYARNGEPEMAQELFMEMQELGLDLNQFSLTSILGTVSDPDEIAKGKQIHCLSIKLGFLSGNLPVSNAVLSMYCRLGSKSDGILVLEEIPEPDVVSWTAILGAYDGEEALELFKFLCSSDVEMNEYTMINVLSAIGNPWLLKQGAQIHGRCFKSGFLSRISISNALITMYGKCWQTSEAQQVFYEMPHRDCISWNAMIAGYAENDLPNSVITFFSLMQQSSSVKPNKFTLAGLLEASSQLGSLKQTMKIHSHVIKLGFAADRSMATGLVTAYSKCNAIQESKKAFDETEIHKRDIHLINALVASYVQNGYNADALKLFRNLQNLSMNVHWVTCSIILKACGALAALDQGKHFHSVALKSGADRNYFVGSSIVDMYCKCGSIDDAEKAFETLPKDNLASWNAMIMGFAQHGFCNKVFELFEEMVGLGIGPDEITFIGVLYSCCHAGLIKEADAYLNSMSVDHGVTPCLEHYSCIVDLLGRVGKLEEAKRSIDQMPISPDALIWQIFLSACTIYGNIELGKVAAKELLKLQPENESTYVLLSNLYASAGMWDEVGKMRQVMKDRTVIKEPGCSWIELKGMIYSFFANDNSHPQNEEICLYLVSLNNQMTAVL